MKKSLCCLCLFVLTGGARAADLPEGWLRDWEAATSQASETEKPMFVVFSAPWCIPCQSMVRNIYPQDQVRQQLSEWVSVYIDVDENEEIAAKYRAHQLPTLVYLNPDATEINRTVGAVTSVEQMIELLETKGGAKFAGGATSLAAQGEINRLSEQIEADPTNSDLRKKRFELILDQAIYQVARENLNVALQDYRVLVRSDRAARQALQEDYSFLRILTSIERRPEFKLQYLGNFEESFPNSKRLATIWVVSAKDAMQKADYKTSAANMKKYMVRFPAGDFIDEFELLLPQIEDFLELSKDVSFD